MANTGSIMIQIFTGNMRKVFGLWRQLTAGGILLALALLLPGCESSEQSSEKQAAKSLSDAHKEKIREFWQVYREATKLRIAGALDRAAPLYRKALELNPDHEDALYYCGGIEFELGAPEQARRRWQHLTKVNPQSSRAFMRLGDFFMQRDSEHFDLSKAHQHYLQASRINRAETGPIWRLAEVALMQGNLAEADDLFAKILVSNNKNALAHFFRAFIAWQQGNKTRAEASARQVFANLTGEVPAHGLPGEGDTKAGVSLSKGDKLIVLTIDLNDLQANKDTADALGLLEAKFKKLRDRF